MSNVRPVISRVLVILPKEIRVVVRVQKLVSLVSTITKKRGTQIKIHETTNKKGNCTIN